MHTECLPSGYNTHRPEDRRAMLSAIGAASVDALFAAIPSSLRLNRPLNTPASMNEWELERHMHALAEKNTTSKTMRYFLGGGAYEHHIPAAIDALASRGEFLTSYTPYQPEISQGLLQALYEYQTALAAITGLPVVNGSCYDGATALADAAWACRLIIGKDGGQDIVASEGIWPHYRTVLSTYMEGRAVKLHTPPLDARSGAIDLAALEALFQQENPAGFLFQTPNALGVVEDVAAIAALCARYGVVSVCALNPLLSGLITPPGKLGVDIVVCDGQVLGLPLNAGGPSLGVFATRREYRKYVPGRLIGKVTDIRGNPAYALVYEDREQHVARERATSNICSNQALNALRAAMFVALTGEEGFRRLSALNTRKAHYLADKLAEIPGVALAHDGVFFNEFVLRLPVPAARTLAAMQSDGIFAGIDYSGQFGLGHALLVAVTEVKSRADLDYYAQSLRKAVA